jgi:hypothetical protein
MHEVIEALHGKAHPSAVTDEERTFRDELAKVLGCGWYSSARLLRATAAEQAQAFLRSVGKWTTPDPQQPPRASPESPPVSTTSP